MAELFCTTLIKYNKYYKNMCRKDRKKLKLMYAKKKFVFLRTSKTKNWSFLLHQRNVVHK